MTFPRFQSTIMFQAVRSSVPLQNGLYAHFHRQTRTLKMNKRQIEDLEKRFLKLLRKKPKSKSEVEESVRLGELLEQAYDDESKPMLDDLKKAGIQVNSVWDLVNTTETYPEGVPILIEHLSQPYNLRTKEGIVRALAVKDARGVAAEPLMQFLGTIDKNNDALVWIIGNSLEYVFSDDVVSQVAEVALDPSYGDDSRTPFVRALGKSKSDKARQTLELLTSDVSDVVRTEALETLKKRKVS